MADSGRTVLLAAPRASCAGVRRAVETVEAALERFGPPLYVRRQIVHNAHVVEDLAQRGVVFVEEVEEVPRGAVVVFSAHGVAPQVRAAAQARELTVIDATCPLVAKVHAEARRFSAAGRTIVLVGHDGHEEVEGTVGEVAGNVQIVGGLDDVASLQVEDPDRVAYLTQTTLAVDETEEVVAALRARFPALVGPAASDICYATQNRQDGVRALAADADLVLVIGSTNSSNSRRLVEVAERTSAPARLIEDATAMQPEWLTDVRTVGLTAGASAPESLVQHALKRLATLGFDDVREVTVARERTRFAATPIPS